MLLNKELVLQLEYKLIEAIKTSDIAFLKNHLHDGLFFVAPDGSIITKAMDIMAHQSRQMQVEYIEPFFEDVKIMQDTAVVLVDYETKGTMLGNPIEGRFRYIRFWKQFHQDLKIIGGSCHQLKLLENKYQ